MASVFDVNAGLLINEVSKSLKENKDLIAPDWAKFVKTGADKERPPQDSDWWYVRLAALLRTIYVRGSPVGIQRLRTKFGSRAKRGLKPKKHAKAGGKIIRHALQVLEKHGLVKVVPKKGRVLTPEGKSLLDKKAELLVRKQ